MYSGPDMAHRLWSVMVTKSTSVTRAASATSARVPPPSDATVWTWMAPTHSRAPRADGASNGKRVATDTTTADTNVNSPVTSVIFIRRFSTARQRRPRRWWRRKGSRGPY